MRALRDVGARHGQGEARDAVYRSGVLVPTEALELPENARVRITVQAIADARTPPSVARLTGLGRRIGVLPLDWTLFGLALAIYAVTRLWALDEFPIYFFGDEAFHALKGEELAAAGFRDATGTWLPIYFEAAGQRWTPALGVYPHALTVSLFGKSVVVTRATSAVVTVLGAAAVGLILNYVFKARWWWTGPLLLAITPAWFLHSRTAFETAMMTAFYGCFLLFYLLYRCRSPRYLFAAVVFGAATFYTYSNGQLVMVALGLFLLLSDLRYHLRHWRIALLGLALAGVLALPLVTFRIAHAGAMETHLRAIDSYWFRQIHVVDKLEQSLRTYWNGLSPAYWFFEHGQDIARHRMKDSGYIRAEVLPLFLTGLGVCLWRVRSSPHRAIVLAALAAPAGAALVGVGITRVLAFVMPATILTALGLEFVLARLARWASPKLLGAVGFAVLSSASLLMLRGAITEGPLWFRDYGLYGMQYGATQIFEETIPSYLNRDAEARIIVSPAWANGAHVFIRFFLPPDQRSRVSMGNVDGYLFDKRDLSPNTVFIMTPAEFERARISPKFSTVAVEQMLPYPDDSPGFFVARLAYAEDADAIFAAEREARQRPVEESAQIGGDAVIVRYSRLGAGQLRHLFDGDAFTLVRGLEANPLLIDLAFATPRAASELAMHFGSMEFSLTASLYADAASEPIVYAETYRGVPPDPQIEMAFDRGPPTISRLRLEIQNLNIPPGQTAHIHVRELTLR